MVNLKISNRNIAVFVDALNHRMTKVETNTKWMKWIMGYEALLLTSILVGLIVRLLGG